MDRTILLLYHGAAANATDGLVLAALAGGQTGSAVVTVAVLRVVVVLASVALAPVASVASAGAGSELSSYLGLTEPPDLFTGVSPMLAILRDTIAAKEAAHFGELR